MFWIAYDIAKYHSSFPLKNWIRSRNTRLQILAMAAMFAHDFVWRERYVIPSYAYEDEEIPFGGNEISQKKFGEGRSSAGEIPKLLRQD